MLRVNTGGWASDPMKWPHRQKKIGGADVIPEPPTCPSRDLKIDDVTT